MQKICLRIDDIGASSKKFEVYSKTSYANFFLLKYLKFFKAWGPYSEMSMSHWEQIFGILSEYNAKLTVGITASWVEKDSTLVPFPEKYPAQADLLMQASSKKLIEIANHGLTHCVVGKHLPRMFTSNRKYHREFWDWVPRDVHFEHLEKSQNIFKEWLGNAATTFIPPGNVYSVDTLEAAEKYGIKRINSYINHHIDSNVHIINDDKIDAFHDRELVLEGVEWLRKKLASFGSKTSYRFIRDIK